MSGVTGGMNYGNFSGGGSYGSYDNHSSKPNRSGTNYGGR